MERRRNQRERILELLQAAGPRGLTNLVLNEICFRYGARLWELRKAGYEIETKQDSENVFRFVLRGKRQPEQEKLFA